jgi:hypothetical protein
MAIFAIIQRSPGDNIAGVCCIKRFLKPVLTPKGIRQWDKIKGELRQ